jgi:hypothetical protein
MKRKNYDLQFFIIIAETGVQLMYLIRQPQHFKYSSQGFSYLIKSLKCLRGALIVSIDYYHRNDKANDIIICYIFIKI